MSEMKLKDSDIQWRFLHYKSMGGASWGERKGRGQRLCGIYEAILLYQGNSHDFNKMAI